MAEEARTLRQEPGPQCADSDDDSIHLADLGATRWALQKKSGCASMRSHGDVLVRSQVIGFKKIKVFYQRKYWRGKTGIAGKRNAHDVVLDHAGAALLESLPFSISERQSGMFGLLHALESVATLLLMCDRRDLGTAIGERPPKPGTESEGFCRYRCKTRCSDGSKEFFEPNLYLFDAYPGGIGFSEPLYRAHELLLSKTRELIAACECESGCPSCVGPAGDLAPGPKRRRWQFLERVCGLDGRDRQIFATGGAATRARRRVVCAGSPARTGASWMSMRRAGAGAGRDLGAHKIRQASERAELVFDAGISGSFSQRRLDLLCRTQDENAAQNGARRPRIRRSGCFWIRKLPDWRAARELTRF